MQNLVGIKGRRSKMRFSVPHPIPYQGSKRKLASAILSLVPSRSFGRLIEPFAGSAAITIAAAAKNQCNRFLLADILQPLVELWRQILTDPDALANRYRTIWRSQLRSPRKRFDDIRDEFNRDREPAKLLFLLARCVKNSVRFNPAGEFNQSPDNRRLGMRPETMEQEISGAHKLLAGRCEVLCADFRETLRLATPNDLVYLDPPYQGTSYGRDRRYVRGVERDALIDTLTDLNRRGIQFLLSYDGKCGDKTYGEALPLSLRTHRVFVDAGRSSQGTLNGKNVKTLESLYISADLCEGMGIPSVLHWKERTSGALLFY